VLNINPAQKITNIKQNITNTQTRNSKTNKTKTIEQQQGNGTINKVLRQKP
jgi:hypothetical protein